MDTIGKRVRSARQDLGFTMKQLHEITGLSTGNISDIENEKNMPSVSSLVSLSRALRRSLDWLLTGDESNTRNSEQTTICDGVPLSPTEADLVAMFRLLDERGREMIFDTAMMMDEKATGEKGSIYSTYIEDERKQKSDPEEGLEARHGTA